MRCAIMMPQGWKGGMLNVAIMFCNTISRLKVNGETVGVSLCLPEGYENDSLDQVDRSVNVIFFKTAAMNASDPRMHFLQPHRDLSKAPWANYSYPQALEDEMDIVLADVWITMTAFFSHGPLIPLKPTIVYAPDFIQRVVPEIYGKDFSGVWDINAWQAVTMQDSNAVICTSKRTALDAVSYAGVRKEKVHILPLTDLPLFDVSDNTPENLVSKGKALKAFLTSVDDVQPDSHSADEPTSKDEHTVDYFIWATNTTQHKNHRRALEALRLYYERHNGKLRCIVSGAMTDWFHSDHPVQDPYIVEIREKLRSSNYFDGKLSIAGPMSPAIYAETVRNAAFLWHNVLYDNGTFSVIDAARLGTRSLVSKYPQMVEICQEYGINANYFDPWDAGDTALALKAMEASLVVDGIGATMLNREQSTTTFESSIQALLTSIFADQRNLRREYRAHD